MESGPPMDFEGYFMGLESDARDAFAEDAGTTAEYIRDHLLAGRRMPRRALLDGIEEALKRRRAAITRQELVAFFDERAGEAA